MEVLLDKLSAQDCNLESALKALNEVKKFISAPEHILGSPLQKHGEVAEHMQVGFSNARAAVQGFRQMYTFDGVGRLAMEDYLRDGRMIQSKFCNGIQGTFSAIRHHLSDYPMFIAGGGTYDIPRDQYAQLIDIYERGETARSSLMRTEETLYKAMDACVFQQLPVDPRHGVRTPVAACPGRWEQDGVVRVQFVFLHQKVYRLL